MQTTTFTHDNVTYSYSIKFKKWVFEVQNTGFQFLESCRGAENAHKVARLVAGSAKRNAKKGAVMDNLARVSIDRLLNRLTVKEKFFKI